MEGATLRNQVITHGLAWAVVLGGTNLALQRFVARNPKSAIATKTQGGGFFDPVPYADYIVCLFGQFTIQPLLWSLAFFGRNTSESWWYGAQPQAASGEFLAYCAGYFVQDCVTHFANTTPLLALHHVASAIVSVAAASSNGWLGLSVSTAQVLEVGSIALEFGELGWAPRVPMYLVNILSSLLPWLWLIPAILAKPPDAYAWLVGVAGIIASGIRAKDNWAMYVDAVEQEKNSNGHKTEKKGK